MEYTMDILLTIVVVSCSSILKTIVTAKTCSNTILNENAEHINCSRRSFKEMPEYLFYQETRNVISIDMSWNFFQEINTTILERYTNLNQLILAGNRNLGLETIVKNVSLTRNVKPQRLCLDRLQPTALTSNELHENFFCADFFKRVTHLTVRANNINSFHIGIFHCVPNLQFLSLGFNYIWQIEPGISTRNMSTFQYLPFPYQFFKRFKYLDLSRLIQLPNLYEDVHNKSTISELFLHNQVEYYADDLDVTDPDMNTTYYNTWNNLEYIYCTHVQLGDLIDNTPWETLPSLIFFDISFNQGQKSVVKAVPTLPNLQIYNVTDCGLGKFDNNAFEFMPKLVYLNLSQNHMGTANNNFRDLFYPLKKLEILSLASNKISVLPRDSFVPLVSLKYIDLSGNFLQYIDITWTSNMLSYINLTSNNLIDDFINEPTRDNLTYIPSSIVLDIGPELVCSCTSQNFFRWIEDNDHVVIPKYQTSNCSFNDRSFLLPKARESLESSHECTSIVVPLTICAGIVFVVVLALSIVVHMYKIYITYFFYRLKLKLIGTNTYRTGTNESSLYDVYLAVAYEDLAWARDTIVSYLENVKGYCVYLYERDSIPGSTIADNIVYGLSNSSCVIVILSSHFINDEWRDWELSMAVASGRSRIAIVKTGNVTSRGLHMNSMLKSLIFPHPKVTFCEWDQGTCGDDVLRGTLELHIQSNQEKRPNKTGSTPDSNCVI